MILYQVGLFIVNVERKSLIKQLESLNDLLKKPKENPEKLSDSSLIDLYLKTFRLSKQSEIEKNQLVIFLLYKKHTPAYFRLSGETFTAFGFQYEIESNSPSEVMDILKNHDIEMPDSLMDVLRKLTYQINSGNYH